jgi:hypothetical protein
MDSFPLHIVPPRGDDELDAVHAAGLGVYALHEVTGVAFAGLLGAIAGYEQRHELLPSVRASAPARHARARGLCEVVERSLATMTRDSDRVTATSKALGVPRDEIVAALVGYPSHEARAVRVVDRDHPLGASMQLERERLDGVARSVAVRALLEELSRRERLS